MPSAGRVSRASARLRRSAYMMRVIDGSGAEEAAVSLIRYAAINVIRSRRRTITAMIGVLLAVTFVSGTFIAIDSSTRATLDAFLSNLPSALQEITVASGSFSIPRGTAALSEDLAARLNVSIGATVTFRLSSFDPTNPTGPWVNVTVAAVFGGVRPGGGPVFPPLAVVHVDDAAWYEGQLGYQYMGDGLTGEIRIDRARVLDPYNIEASRGNLAILERQINSVLGQFGGHISSDNIPNALSSFESALIIQRIFYLGLSTPVLLLGIYLGAIGIDLSHAERRRELAVLKTRGASRDQTLGLLVLEASFGGVIAALIGLVAGVGLSRLLLAFVSLF